MTATDPWQPLTVAPDPDPGTDTPPDGWGPQNATDLNTEEAAYEAAAQKARDIATALYRLQIQDEARQQKTAAERANLQRPEMTRLDALLATEFDAPAYRIQDLWPTGGRILLTAQWKAGKSVMVGNIIRALADGDPFLDTFTPAQARHILLIDNELDPARLQQWFRDQNITNTDRVTLLSLRGRTAAFNILDAEPRAEWAQEITQTCSPDVIILDCLRPILDAFGLDENHEAGKFLVAYDALLAETGAAEGGIVHHMGHGAERSRGDSRLLDWPDAVWKIVRDKDDDTDSDLDDPQGSRYFSAYGRDVDHGQTELVFDPTTRRLTLGHKTRHQATADRRLLKADHAVIAAVTETPGINKTRLRKACGKYGTTNNETIDDAVDRLVEDGLILRVISGPQRLHYPTTSQDPAHPAQNGLGTLKGPLTSTYTETMPNDAQKTVGITPNHDRKASDEMSDAHLFPDALGHALPTLPKSLKGLGGVKDAIDPAQHAQPKLGTVNTPKTKPCPDCGTNTIPTTHRRCPQCAQDIASLAAQDHDL